MPRTSTDLRIYKRGFTLIELLVVVAIIGGLIAILIPSLGRARATAQRTVCAANLSGQGKAFAVYAQQNNDQLVNASNFGGQWLHDQERANCDLLIDVKLTDTQSATSIRKWFYCPSNFAANQDIAWQGLNGNNGSAGTPSGFRYLDYCYFNERNFSTAAGAGTVLKPDGLFRNSGATPKLRFQRNLLKTQRAGEAELVTDEIITSTINAPYDFHANNPGSAFHETSAHLRGKLPEGMNVLTYDGHVSWRRFPALGAAFKAITPIIQGAGYQAGGTQYMWFIDP